MGLKLAPKPEDIIHDATALPEDVMVGKVFYNNDGRQVGTGAALTVLSAHINGNENLGNKSYSDVGTLKNIDGDSYLSANATEYDFWTKIDAGKALNYSKILKHSFSGLQNKALAGVKINDGVYQTVAYKKGMVTSVAYDRVTLNVQRDYDILFHFNAAGLVERIEILGSSTDPMDITIYLVDTTM